MKRPVHFGNFIVAVFGVTKDQRDDCIYARSVIVLFMFDKTTIETFLDFNE